MAELNVDSVDMGCENRQCAHIQSDLAITDLAIADTLLYQTLCNLSGAHQPLSPCYNGHAMYNGPDKFFKSAADTRWG